MLELNELIAIMAASLVAGANVKRPVTPDQITASVRCAKLIWAEVLKQERSAVPKEEK